MENDTARVIAKEIFDPVLEELEEKAEKAQKEYDEEIKRSGQTLGLYRAFSTDVRSDRELADILMRDKKNELCADADYCLRKLDALNRKMNGMKSTTDGIEQLSYIIGWYSKLEAPAAQLDYVTGNKRHLKKRIQDDQEKWNAVIHGKEGEALLKKAQLNHAHEDLQKGKTELSEAEHNLDTANRLIAEKEVSYQEDLKTNYEQMLVRNKERFDDENQALEDLFKAEDDLMEERYQKAFTQKASLKPGLKSLFANKNQGNTEKPAEESPTDDIKKSLDEKRKQAADIRKGWLKELMKPAEEIRELRKTIDGYTLDIKNAHAKIQASENIISRLGEE